MSGVPARAPVRGYVVAVRRTAGQGQQEQDPMYLPRVQRQGERTGCVQDPAGLLQRGQ